MKTQADENGPANARRLLKLLASAGVKANQPLQNAWVQSEALKALRLEGDDLDAALIFAGGEDWIDNGTKAGTVVLTEKGVREGKR
jgi:hypothetical protein